MSETNVVKVLIAALDIEVAAKIAEALKQAVNTRLIEERIPGDFEITMAVNNVQAEKDVDNPEYGMIIASLDMINELWPNFLARYAGGAFIYPAVPKGETLPESVKKIAHNGKVLEY